MRSKGLKKLHKSFKTCVIKPLDPVGIQSPGKGVSEPAIVYEDNHQINRFCPGVARRASAFIFLSDGSSAACVEWGQGITAGIEWGEGVTAGVGWNAVAAGFPASLSSGGVNGAAGGGAFVEPVHLWRYAWPGRCCCR